MSFRQGFHCCNQNNYLSFRAGETAKMKTPDGTISECTCTDLGDCVPKGVTCTPNRDFCQNNNKCYCNSDGTIGTCQTCPDFCSNGKCCFEECQEICETLLSDYGPYEVCTTVCSIHCY